MTLGADDLALYRLHARPAGWAGVEKFLLGGRRTGVRQSLGVQQGGDALDGRRRVWIVGCHT